MHRLPTSGDPFYLLRQIDPPERAARVAAGFADPVDRLVAEALAGAAAGKHVLPRRKLREALERAPRHEAGRSALLRLSSNAIVQGQDPEEILTPPLSEQERRWQARCARERSIRVVPSCWRSTQRSPRSRCGIPWVWTPRACGRRAPAQRRPRADPRSREIVEASLGDAPDARSLLLRAEAFSAVEEYGAMLETLSNLAFRVAQESEQGIRRSVDTAGASWPARHPPATRSSPGCATACCGSTASIPGASEAT